mgnify:CR=1 FL=1
MCGIVGIISAEAAEPDCILGCIGHRGPDDRGWIKHENIALGHTRLSIIDLSRDGHQPMSDPSGRYTITYNGEIYNYRELRAELETRGHAFRTKSDTEVVLHAYMEWGRNCPARLRGMFAFGILDREPRAQDSHLFLARDRFGIKPIVYSENHDRFVFASELKTLLKAEPLTPVLREESVLEYLQYGAISQPWTIYRDIFHLPAASWMEVDARGRIRHTGRYWNFLDHLSEHREELQKRSYADQVTRTRELLEDATRAHLIADVPVGAFLSGGVDSSAVCALMQKISGQPVHTFSVGFAENAEVMDYRIAAERLDWTLGTEHTRVVISHADVAEVMNDIIPALDQPSVDGTNTWFVSRAAARDVKVAISGLGGDELFAGYPHFRALLRASQKNASIFDHLAATLHQRRPNRFTYERMCRVIGPDKTIAAIRREIPPEKISSIVQPHLLKHDHLPTTRTTLPDAPDMISRISLAEGEGYLAHTLLRDSDAMSMAHSLEVRPVLLDHRLAEHAIALPPEAKIRGAQNKSALVDAVRDLIPEECWKRPKKGFSMPMGQWLNGPLQEQALSCLASAPARNIFTKEWLAATQQQARQKQLTRKDWNWFILLSWINQSQPGIG